MARRVVLHIGPRKTATTYLQRILQSLVKSRTIPGRSYPLRTRGRFDHNQVPGLIDLARIHDEIGLQDDAWNHLDGSDGAALVRAVQAAPADVVLSAEAMSVLREPGAQAIVDAFAPAPVDVVITLRGLNRVLPSSWQQHIRNGNYMEYLDYLNQRAYERDNDVDKSEMRRGFWRAYRYGDLTRRWQSVARSVTLVTVPVTASDPALTWRRFKAAANIEGWPEVPPQIRADRANVSLTGAETYALAQLNLDARTEGEGRREVRATHRRLLREGWTERPDRGRRLGLPEPMRPVIAEWMTTDVDDLRQCDVPVFGDLDELLPSRMDSDPGLPDAQEVAQATEAAQILLAQSPR
jgi:hypothetical protein